MGCINVCVLRCVCCFDVCFIGMCVCFEMRVEMGIDTILKIPIPFSILLIDPIPYRVQTGLLTLFFFYTIFSE